MGDDESRASGSREGRVERKETPIAAIIMTMGFFCVSPPENIFPDWTRCAYKMEAYDFWYNDMHYPIQFLLLPHHSGISRFPLATTLAHFPSILKKL